MPTQENRAIFDRRKNELTVITYYDEKTFKKYCVEKILAYKLNPALREGLFFRNMSRIRCYFSFLAVCSGVLCVGELAVRDFSKRLLPYFIITLFFSIFIYPCTGWVIWVLSGLRFRYNWVCDRGKSEYIRASKREFEKQPVFRQQVRITPEKIMWNTPLQEETHSMNYIYKQRKNDIYLLEYFPYYKNNKYTGDFVNPSTSLHFCKKNYSEDDWQIIYDTLPRLKPLSALLCAARTLPSRAK
ncbi:hypothetical protein MR657_02290 [bacterium]|nr:hypothetical protein [bacterium]